MKDNTLASFLKSNIKLGVDYEKESPTKYSEGKIKGYGTVLKLIEVWEEYSNERV